MAAHSLHKVLKGLVVERIDEMNELLPGVPADSRNMKTLLQGIDRNNVFTFARGKDQPMICMEVNTGNKKVKFIRVCLKGPEETWFWTLADGTKRPVTDRPNLTGKRFDFTEDGLLDAITTGKQWLGKLSNEGTCPDCRNAAGERPAKRLYAQVLAVHYAGSYWHLGAAREGKKVCMKHASLIARIRALLIL